MYGMEDSWSGASRRRCIARKDGVRPERRNRIVSTCQVNDAVVRRGWTPPLPVIQADRLFGYLPTPLPTAAYRLHGMRFALGPILKGFTMRKTPIGEHVDLTAAQRRELEKIACAPSGHPEGKGAEWSVRVRLQAIGLLELRRIFEFRLGKHVNRHDRNMWFVTEAGYAALRLVALAIMIVILTVK